MEHSKWKANGALMFENNIMMKEFLTQRQKNIRAQHSRRDSCRPKGRKENLSAISSIQRHRSARSVLESQSQRSVRNDTNMYVETTDTEQTLQNANPIQTGGHSFQVSEHYGDHHFDVYNENREKKTVHRDVKEYNQRSKEDSVLKNLKERIEELENKFEF